MKKFTFTLFTFCSLIFGIQAQTATGTITDENGDPLFSVTVVEKGTTNGTTTDFNGKFSLNFTGENRTLVISFLGYRDKEVTYDGSAINHQMEVDAIGIDQVVVSASKRKEKVLDAPASVTVLGVDQLDKTAAITAVDHLKKVPGVDVMTTGLISSNVNIRGFNNIFSGAMLTVVDNRIARVPSLRVNGYQFIPACNYDIAKMEVVRGPASALYGPNAANGVLAMTTKSPLDQERNFETTIGYMVGARQANDTVFSGDGTQFVAPKYTEFKDRIVFGPELSHSGKINDKFGYRVSWGYFQGNDFEHYDFREPSVGDTVWFGTVRNGEEFEVDSARGPVVFDRDFEIQKFNVDGRIDYQITDDISVILNGGLAQSTNLELTGLGGGQAIDWRYGYGQARFQWKNLFAQYFMNSSNAGDTYLIPQSGNNIQRLIDKSKLHVVQLQHGTDNIKNLSLIYGLDVLLTRPNTESTINGRFEDDDNINQFGGYLQAEYDVSPKFSTLAAARVDYEDKINEVQVSPRIALVYKPTPRHTTRITYNRAFNSPTSLNYSLDLLNSIHPLGYGIRGMGNVDGYGYLRASDANLLQMDFNWDDLSYGQDGLPALFDYNNSDINNIAFEGYKSVLISQFVPLAEANGIPAALVPTLVGSLLLGADLSDVSHMGLDLVDFAGAENPDVYASSFDLANLPDKGNVESSITQTIETGYKGIIADKLFLQTDFYYTRIENFSSPLTNITPNVIFDQNELIANLTPVLQNNLENNPIIVASLPTLLPLLDGNATYGGTLNGTILDELLFIINGVNAQVGLGNVVTDNQENSNDVILTYLNLGTVEVFGGDFGAKVEATKDLSFSASFSFVNKDRIEMEGASNGFVALNAPKFKTAVGVDYTFKKSGLGLSGTWRWQDAFPANSAVYVGEVRAANYVDLGLSYRPNFSKNTLLTLDVTNVLGYEHQRFPGTPKIGRLGMLRLRHTFKSRK